MWASKEEGDIEDVIAEPRREDHLQMVCLTRSCHAGKCCSLVEKRKHGEPKKGPAASH